MIYLASPSIEKNELYPKGKVDMQDECRPINFKKLLIIELFD